MQEIKINVHFVKKSLCLVICNLLFITQGIAQSPVSTDERTSSTLVVDRKVSIVEDAKRTYSSTQSEQEGLHFGPFKTTYGGSFSSTFRSYRDLDNQDGLEDFLKSSWHQSLSLWLHMTTENYHSLTFQTSLNHIDRTTGVTYTGIGDDLDGPNLDIASWTFPLVDTESMLMSGTLGRQFIFVGRGLAYSALHDGATLSLHHDVWSHKYFISRTKPREDNIDYSVPGFDKEGERIFVGGEVSYHAIDNMTLYGFVVSQNDMDGELPDDTTQDYTYDSVYYGLGATYSPLPYLSTWTEWIIENGNGFTDANRTQHESTDIDAWAYLAGLKFKADHVTKPVIELETAYGSGDNDRLNVTNTVDGDTDGLDTNFLYFGYYQAGYALQPRLSNLRLYSFSSSFLPFPNHDYLKDMLIGGKYYWYEKDVTEGRISDLDATESENHVGQEIDAYLYWKLSDNILASFRYGVFYPGEAFAADKQDKTHFFYTRLNVDF